jgi:hypothetical protein
MIQPDDDRVNVRLNLDYLLEKVIAILLFLLGSDGLGIIQLMEGLSKFWVVKEIRTFREGLQVQEIEKENKVEDYVAKAK